MLHCRNGNGPDNVDWFTAIADWVEHGRAPARVLARKLGADRQIVNERPLCAYPQRAIHDGNGSTTDAASFACR